MISFQVKRSGVEIAIDVDDEGIQVLIDALSSIRGSGSHIHLRAPSAGGSELSETTPWGHAAVGEVIIGHGGD
jgi:hypothetical protein